MTQINQIFYAIFTVFGIGLLLNSFTGFRSEKDYFKKNIYWTLSISFISLATFLWAIIPFTSFKLLGIAAGSFITSTIFLAILIRSLNQEISKRSIFITLILVLCFYMSFWYFRDIHFYIERLRIAVYGLVLTTTWLLFEITRLIKKDKSPHLKSLVTLVIVQLAFMLSRIYITETQGRPSYLNIYEEQGIGFNVRISVSAFYFLMFVFIGNYFYEKLWEKARYHASRNENKMLFSLNSLSLARDNETGNHILRTQHYVKTIALRLRSLGYFADELSLKSIDLLYRAAPLHDIGKVGIPDSILLKPSKLTDEEWEVMKTHTSIGEQVLSAAETSLAGDDEDVISKAIKIAGAHHEKWNGTGYPRGLAGEEIPLEARIMAIADMYDALISKRVYKKDWPHEKAVTEIQSQKGIAFDPMIVEAFIMEADSFERIAEDLKD